MTAVRIRRDFRTIRATVLALSETFSTEENSTLQNFPLPVVVFDSADRVVWYNLKFQNEFLADRAARTGDIRQFTGGLGLRDIRKSERFDAEVGGKAYTVYFNHIQCAGRQSYVLLYSEDTRLKRIARAYALEKPVVAMLAMDRYDITSCCTYDGHNRAAVFNPPPLVRNPVLYCGNNTDVSFCRHNIA